MSTPRWYEQSESGLGTVDLGAYEAAAQPLRRKLVEEGDLLPVEELRDRWASRHARGGFFTVEIDQRAYAPAFYLDASIDAQQLTDVTALLGDLHGWSKWHFFTATNGSLGAVTPLDALRNGQVDRVKRAARAYVEC